MWSSSQTASRPPALSHSSAQGCIISCCWWLQWMELPGPRATLAVLPGDLPWSCLYLHELDPWTRISFRIKNINHLGCNVKTEACHVQIPDPTVCRLGRRIAGILSAGNHHFMADGKKKKKSRWAFPPLGLKSWSWATVCIFLMDSFLHAVDSAFPHACLGNGWYLMGMCQVFVNLCVQARGSRVLCRAISIHFPSLDTVSFQILEL